MFTIGSGSSSTTGDNLDRLRRKGVVVASSLDSLRRFDEEHKNSEPGRFRRKGVASSSLDSVRRFADDEDNDPGP